MFFAQGRDLAGQRPDETNAVCRRARNEIVVPTVRHSVCGCVLPVHALKVPFLRRPINLTIAPNDADKRLQRSAADLPVRLQPPVRFGQSFSLFEEVKPLEYKVIRPRAQVIHNSFLFAIYSFEPSFFDMLVKDR